MKENRVHGSQTGVFPCSTRVRIAPPMRVFDTRK
jgi:hypothetical protein